VHARIDGDDARRFDLPRQHRTHAVLNQKRIGAEKQRIGRFGIINVQMHAIEPQSFEDGEGCAIDFDRPAQQRGEIRLGHLFHAG